ncbi:hypothetical protein KUCAC02_030300, partial [Chaenocephalus aceratus]
PSQHFSFQRAAPQYVFLQGLHGFNGGFAHFSSLNLLKALWLHQAAPDTASHSDLGRLQAGRTQTLFCKRSQGERACLSK